MTQAVLNTNFPAFLPCTQRGFILLCFPHSEIVKMLKDTTHAIDLSIPSYVHTAQEVLGKAGIDQTWPSTALILRCVIQEQKDIGSGKSHWWIAADAR